MDLDHIFTVNGGWSEWQEWSSCPIECEAKTRIRYCDDPSTQHGGVYCSGKGTESSPCNEEIQIPGTIMDNLLTFWKYLSTLYTDNFGYYHGCYRDKISGLRTLPSNYMKSSSDMTIEMCLCHCFKAGRAFAGVQYHFECFCGDILPPIQVPEEECNAPCRGNSSQMCGGAERNSVYGTGLDSQGKRR